MVLQQISHEEMEDQEFHLKKQAYDVFLKRYATLDEKDYLEVELRLEESRLREKRAQAKYRHLTPPLSPSNSFKKELWGIEWGLSRVERLFGEGEMLAATSLWSQKRNEQAIKTLQETVPGLKLERQKFEGELLSLPQEGGDPQLRAVKKTLLQEQINQSDLLLQAMQRTIERLEVEKEIASLQPEQKQLYHRNRQIKSEIKLLVQQRDLIMKKRGILEEDYERLKEEITLSTEITPDAFGGEPAVQIPEEVTQRIQVTENLLSLLTGEEAALQKQITEQEELLKKVEQRIEEELSKTKPGYWIKKVLLRIKKLL
ncbi:MAG: hypothetical protein HYT77_05410 [Deltaproteobacteria bacterium]|nr:hypothetical protein [Deltaproteobacteria bacterium]